MEYFIIFIIIIILLFIFYYYYYFTIYFCRIDYHVSTEYLIPLIYPSNILR